MEATLSQELRDYLRAVVEEDEERKRDHLCWLDENPNEPDRDQQRAETNRAASSPARRWPRWRPSRPERVSTCLVMSEGPASHQLGGPLGGALLCAHLRVTTTATLRAMVLPGGAIALWPEPV